MRSREDQIVLDTLSFMARVGSQIDMFRSKLRQATNVAIASFVECRYYGNDLYLCICLESDLEPERTLTWWMDIRARDEGWLIEASVLWNGRDMVAQVPSQVVSNFQAAQQEVPRMLNHLLEAGGLALANARPVPPSDQLDDLNTRGLN